MWFLAQLAQTFEDWKPVKLLLSFFYSLVSFLLIWQSVLVGVKPLCEAMLDCYHWNHWGQMPMKLASKYNDFSYKTNTFKMSLAKRCSITLGPNALNGSGWYAFSIRAKRTIWLALPFQYKHQHNFYVRVSLTAWFDLKVSKGLGHGMIYTLSKCQRDITNIQLLTLYPRKRVLCNIDRFRVQSNCIWQ